MVKHIFYIPKVIGTFKIYLEDLINKLMSQVQFNREYAFHKKNVVI